MVTVDEIEERSHRLEKIRKELRKQLDACQKMRQRTVFTVDYESAILLTVPEKKAMLRQLQASHGYLFSLAVDFSTQKRRRRPSYTRIVVNAKLRRVPLSQLV